MQYTAIMDETTIGGKNPVGWTLGELTEWVTRHGAPIWRGTQLAEWLFHRCETDPALMSNLPAALREALLSEAPPFLPAERTRRESEDGTVKWLLGLADGETVETVLIPDGDRATCCVSTQIGCPIGCRFCRTGQSGLVRNLEASEIVGQVLVAIRHLGAREKLTNIVVMGMGEPLLNLEPVHRALLILTSSWGLAMAPRRITVSTAGVLPMLPEFRRRHPEVNLAVSLNAPNQPLRDDLMPGARGWPLDLLLPLLSSLPGGGRHPVTLEYVLLGGVNDTPGHARELSRLVAGTGFTVNLIPWNPVAGGDFVPSDPETVNDFAKALAEAGVFVTVRRGRGADIDAACGQLRAENRG
jgi:23S rRNA (adenine2503-C2)-methyltransferase